MKVLQALFSRRTGCINRSAKANALVCHIPSFADLDGSNTGCRIAECAWNTTNCHFDYDRQSMLTADSSD